MEWRAEPLGNIAFMTSGGTPNRKNREYYTNGTIPWVRSGELENGAIYDTEIKITQAGLNESSAKIFPKGTLLIALYGATIGKLAYLDIDACTNQAVCGIFENDKVILKYLYYYLLFQRPNLVKQGIGGAQPNISQTILKKLLVPYPVDKIEQMCIIARIEELFSELDNGVETLRKTKQQLAVYRQAVLKNAFEGALTSGWRVENRDFTVEKIWLEIVENKKQCKNLKVYELEESIQLSSLPESWKWVNIGDISFGPEYGTSQKSLEKGKVPVVRMGNLQNGIINWTDLVFSNDDAEIEKYRLMPGDVLFNRTNSPELVGKTAIYRGEQEAIFAGYLIRINQFDCINPEYLAYYMNSFTAKQYGNKVKTDGVNQSNINGKKLCSYPFPLCSQEEQAQVVYELESRLSVCDSIEKTVDTALQQAEAMRQSILKQAFEGRL